MASLIGTHNRTNGIKQFPARLTASLNGVGLGGGEIHADTIVIVRDTRVFPDGEAPPDFNTFQPSGSVTWGGYGAYWYSGRTMDGGNFRDAWSQNTADYYQICNEQGGNDAWALQRLVDIERAIMQAANDDGRKCCILNLAGGSPGDFEMWKTICAPFIVEAWENGGNIYGRHVYGDDFVDSDGNVLLGQPQRVIDELEYLRSIGYQGGVALTECGLDGGYGVADIDRFMWQCSAWEAVLRPYADMLIGFAWWETGHSEFNADYTNHLKQMVPYMENSYLGKWEPPNTPPTDPPNGGEMSLIAEYNLNYELPRTNPERVKKVRMVAQGKSGDTWENLPGGVISLELPEGTERVVISQMVEGENPPPPDKPNPDIFDVRAWPTQHKTITQTFGNNPTYYAQFGLPGHEGVDMRAPHGSDIYAISDGTVYEVVPNEDGHNYGIRVRVRSGKYRHIYAHLLETAVNVGDVVTAGQLIGLADNTGNSFGSHLHLTLKHDDANVGGERYEGYPYEIIDPTPWLLAFDPELPVIVDPPLSGKIVNFTDYLMPPTHIGQFVVFEKAAGGTIDHQMQVRDGIVYVVKRAAEGTEYEELRIMGGFIQRRYDTSPADGYPYKLDDGFGWSNWMPVTMQEGEYFKRTPAVTRYDVANGCQQISSDVSESYIKFHKYHESYTLPGGLVKTAVCELHWTWVPGGEELEKYFIAPDLWYVQWGNGDALHYLNEEPQGREPLPLNPIPCLV